VFNEGEGKKMRGEKCIDLDEESGGRMKGTAKIEVV